MDTDQRAAIWAGALLGFGLSGAIDVALFHLVLQWHHFFMSPDVALMLRVDGWLLLTLLAIALGGVPLLWRAARAARTKGLGRMATGGALLGAALFNGGDILVDHFLLELHRLHEGVDSLWPDLAWLTLSVALAVAGALLARSGLRQRGAGADARFTRRPRRS